MPAGASLPPAARELLAVTGLARRFRGVKAIDGVDLSLREGEALGLIGPNGAGKSTLFRLITGLLEPDAGTIIYNGEDLAGVAPEDRYRRGLAWSFQHARCFPSLTVRDHVRLARSHKPAASPAPSGEADRWLAEVDLVGRAGSVVTTLSLAERKLLDYARAACSEPRLLLLDEPFAGLGREQSAVLAHAVGTARRRGVTVLIVEHRLPELLELVDEIAVLADGAIIYRGAPGDALRARPVLQAYFGVES